LIDDKDAQGFGIPEGEEVGLCGRREEEFAVGEDLVAVEGACCHGSSGGGKCSGGGSGGGNSMVSEGGQKLYDHGSKVEVLGG